VIVIADTFGRERGLVRRNKILYLKRGNNTKPLMIDGIMVEGWQAEEIRRGTTLYDH